MSRVIKFRAWDKEDRVMLDWYTWRDEILDAIPHSSGDEWTERCEVMQFTGLHDIKGREVYENDIMRGQIATSHSRSARKREWIAIVRWNDWSSGWILHGPTDGDYRFLPHFKECEVIGNLYQNPELFKV